MKDQKNDYLYQGREWKELSIDLSLHQLTEKTKLPANRVRTALRALGPKEHGGANTLHYNVFFARRGIDYGEYYKNNGEISTRDPDTHPVSIYWEIEELITQLAYANKANNKARGDALCEDALRRLARVISDQGKHRATGDYRYMQLLHNPVIQSYMVQQYFDSLEHRLALLENIAKGLPPLSSAKGLCFIMQKIDAILVDLIDLPNSRESLFRGTPKEVLFQIYDKLMSIRQARKTNVADGSNIAQFNFSPRDSDDTAAEALRSTLQSVTWGSKQEKDNLADLENNYNRYLLSCMSTHEVQCASMFAEEFFQLKNYTEVDSEKECSLLDLVTSDLSEFCREQFSLLDNLDGMAYQVENNSARHMTEAVANELMQNVYQQIMFVLHQPFRLLRAAYTLRYFEAHNCNPERMTKLSKDLQTVMNQLAEDFPSLPLLSSRKPCDTKAFCDAYTQYVVPMLGCVPRPEATVEQQMGIIQAQPEAWLSAALLLRIQCELVACKKAQDAAYEVTERQTALVKRLNEQNSY